MGWGWKAGHKGVIAENYSPLCGDENVLELAMGMVAQIYNYVLTH
jgi:hypothetical protein